jgi:hypothetical protein
MDAQRSAIARQARTYLQTTTTATTLATSRVGRSRGDVLNAADAHARAGKGTESGLSTGTGGLGTVTYSQYISIHLLRRIPLRGIRTTGSTDLDVKGVDAELLAAGSDVLGSQHGSVGGGLVTVSLDLHTTGDTADGFATAGSSLVANSIAY